tara:strand:+ start:48028 stop:48234 length:207 start_codon:yes stop_codon:yes gene_type:complete
MSRVADVDVIQIGGWTITAQDDGLYATRGGTRTKIELIDLSKGDIPPDADPQPNQPISPGPNSQDLPG